MWGGKAMWRGDEYVVPTELVCGWRVFARLKQTAAGGWAVYVANTYDYWEPHTHVLRRVPGEAKDRDGAVRIVETAAAFLEMRGML